MSSFKSLESLWFPSQSFIIEHEGHSSFDSCSDSLFSFPPTPRPPLSRFIDHRRAFLITFKCQRRSNGSKLSTISLCSALQYQWISTLMGKTAATKKWVESRSKGRVWFIWAVKRSGNYKDALGGNDGDIWREEKSREKMNILKPYYGWMDAEIFMIWDLEEWIGIKAVYGGRTFPLCFVW